MINPALARQAIAALSEAYLARRNYELRTFGGYVKHAGRGGSEMEALMDRIEDLLRVPTDVAPVSAPVEQARDGVKLLELMIGPCQAKAQDHDWHDCERCIAMFDVDSRQEFALRLIRAVIAAVRSDSSWSPLASAPRGGSS